VTTDTRTDKGLLVGVRLARDIGRYSSLVVEFHRDYADAADSFRMDQSGPVINLFDQNVQDRADPFLSKRGHVEFGMNRPKVYFRLLGEYSSENYINSFFADRHIATSEFELGYKFSMRTSVSVDFSLVRTAFDQNDNVENDRFGTIRLNHTMTKALSVALAIERYVQAMQQRVVENRAYIGLIYKVSPTNAGANYRHVGGYRTGELGMGSTRAQ
jgi:hypothetical protein